MSKRNFSAEDSVRSAKKPKADSEDLVEGLRTKGRGRTPEELKKLFASRRKEEETRKIHEETFQKLPEEKKQLF